MALPISARRLLSADLRSPRMQWRQSGHSSSARVIGKMAVKGGSDAIHQVRAFDLVGRLQLFLPLPIVALAEKQRGIAQ